MKILYISQKTPFPIHDGGCFAMDALISSLSRIASVNGVFISTSKHPFTAETRAHYSNSFRTLQTVFIDTKVRISSAFIHLLKGKNYNLARFSSTHFRTELSKLLVNSYDFIVCDGLFAAQEMKWMRENSTAKIIIRTHNIEHDIWNYLKANTTNLAKRFYVGSLAKTLKKEELNLLNQADLIWAITENDQFKLNELGVKTPIYVIPVAIPVSDKIADHSQNSCFYLGSMNWLPNIQTVDYLTQKIWSNPESLPHLIIAGSYSDNLSQQNTDQISFIGRVDSVADFMLQSGILVAPILSGSGIRIKLLEAISMGVPCITTNLGATGIDAEAAGIVLAETPAEWRKAIVDLSQNKQLRLEKAEQARSYCAHFHSFESIQHLIIESLER